MYAGDGETVDGVEHVHLEADDPRAHEWSVVVLGPTVGPYVVGTDLDELDPDGRSLEDRRRFRASWGFGDRLLQAVAAALTGCTRPGDLVTRWGGDEFLVLCPGAEGDQLDHLASRMVTAVSEASIGNVRVGASAGTQSCRYRPLPVAAADKAMYAAKLAGGGRVVAGDPAAETSGARA